MNKKRLLNVARALRESKHPNSFSMAKYNFCGTPGCALGHYAYRRDLQRTFSLADDLVLCAGEDDVQLDDRGRIEVGQGLTCCAKPICDHFGISKDQAMRLFSASGCGGAKSAVEAAAYIERFVGAL